MLQVDYKVLGRLVVIIQKARAENVHMRFNIQSLARWLFWLEIAALLLQFVGKLLSKSTSRFYQRHKRHA